MFAETTGKPANRGEGSCLTRSSDLVPDNRELRFVMDSTITPDREVQELTTRARESWKSLRRHETFEHWVTLGRAIDAYRRQVFRVLQINEPKGQRYKRAMGDYLRENGWQNPTPENPVGIADAVRTRLQHIIDHHPEIEAFRATLPLDSLLKQNHPTTVWLAFRKWKIPPTDKNSDRETPTSKLRESVRQLSEENERLTRIVAGGDDWEEQIKALVTTTDTEQLADVIFETLDDDKDRTFYELTDELVRRYAHFIADDIDLQEVSPVLGLFDDARRLRDPKEFIRDDSVKAREYADAILNELDGQTDKPHDDAKVIPLAPLETALAAVNLKLERTPTGDYRIRPLPAGKTVPSPKPIEVPNVKGLPRDERRVAMLKALDLAVHPNTTTDEALASLRGYFQMAEGSLPTQIWGSPKPGPDVITADDKGSVDDRIEDTISSLHDTMQKWHDYVADLNSQLEDSGQELAKVKVERDAALARVKEMELQSQ
jgi:hypothetical protein